jgi:hypothetical protein
MPASPGATILTQRGSRRLLHDELCNDLGVSKDWVLSYPPGSLVQCTVALHVLEYVTPSLLMPVQPSTVSVPEKPSNGFRTVTNCRKVDDFIIFDWRPPDLSPQSD